MNIKFAHVSDCHLGGWRKDSLNKLGCQAFSQMVDTIIEKDADFLVISGDLYDVSNPTVDIVDFTTKELKRLHDKGITVYGIMGSHDFSPRGRSMVRPLISADFFKNVSKPIWLEDTEYPIRLELFEDEKTKVKLTGMRARKKGLELEDFQKLDVKFLEEESGEKIFLLHTMLSELKPVEYQNMESGPKSILPGNFLYYAGGHIHKTIPEELREGIYVISKDSALEEKVIYPGCLAPTNFLELEKQQYGGFCIVSGEIPNGDLEVKYVKLPIKEVIRLYVDGNSKSSVEVNDIIEQEISRGSFEDKIVLLRIEGSLSSGKSYDIQGNDIVQKLKDKGAYEVLIKKNKLISETYEKISINSGETNENIEERLIHEHVQKTDILDFPKDKLKQKIHQLMTALGRDLRDGEKVKDYDRDILEHFYTILEIDLKEDER